LLLHSRSESPRKMPKFGFEVGLVCTRQVSEETPSWQPCARARPTIAAACSFAARSSSRAWDNSKCSPSFPLALTCPPSASPFVLTHAHVTVAMATIVGDASSTATPYPSPPQRLAMPCMRLTVAGLPHHLTAAGAPPMPLFAGAVIGLLLAPVAREPRPASSRAVPHQGCAGTPGWPRGCHLPPAPPHLAGSSPPQQPSRALCMRKEKKDPRVKEKQV
jgi:hypothetical protein